MLGGDTAAEQAPLATDMQPSSRMGTIQGPAVFSTANGAKPYRCLDHSDATEKRSWPPVIARSDFHGDVQKYKEDLTKAFPIEALGVFAPWDPRDYFDEYDWHRLGGEFCYTVLERLQQRNEAELVKFCNGWHETNPSHIEHEALGASNMDVITLFHKDDRTKYGDLFLNKCLEYMRGAYFQMLSDWAKGIRVDAGHFRGANSVVQQKLVQYPQQQQDYAQTYLQQGRPESSQEYKQRLLYSPESGQFKTEHSSTKPKGSKKRNSPKDAKGAYSSGSARQERVSTTGNAHRAFSANYSAYGSLESQPAPPRDQYRSQLPQDGRLQYVQHFHPFDATYSSFMRSASGPSNISMPVVTVALPTRDNPHAANLPYPDAPVLLGGPIPGMQPIATIQHDPNHPMAPMSCGHAYSHTLYRHQQGSSDRAYVPQSSFHEPPLSDRPRADVHLPGSRPSSMITNLDPHQTQHNQFATHQSAQSRRRASASSNKHQELHNKRRSSAATDEDAHRSLGASYDGQASTVPTPHLRYHHQTVESTDMQKSRGTANASRQPKEPKTRLPMSEAQKDAWYSIANDRKDVLELTVMNIKPNGLPVKEILSLLAGSEPSVEYVNSPEADALLPAPRFFNIRLESTEACRRLLLRKVNNVQRDTFRLRVADQYLPETMRWKGSLNRAGAQALNASCKESSGLHRTDGRHQRRSSYQEPDDLDQSRSGLPDAPQLAGGSSRAGQRRNSRYSAQDARSSLPETVLEGDKASTGILGSPAQDREDKYDQPVAAKVVKSTWAKVAAAGHTKALPAQSSKVPPPVITSKSAQHPTPDTKVIGVKPSASIRQDVVQDAPHDSQSTVQSTAEHVSPPPKVDHVVSRKGVATGKIEEPTFGSALVRAPTPTEIDEKSMQTSNIQAVAITAMSSRGAQDEASCLPKTVTMDKSPEMKQKESERNRPEHKVEEISSSQAISPSHAETIQITRSPAQNIPPSPQQVHPVAEKPPGKPPSVASTSVKMSNHATNEDAHAETSPRPALAPASDKAWNQRCQAVFTSIYTHADYEQKIEWYKEAHHVSQHAIQIKTKIEQLGEKVKAGSSKKASDKIARQLRDFKKELTVPDSFLAALSEKVSSQHRKGLYDPPAGAFEFIDSIKAEPEDSQSEVSGTVKQPAPTKDRTEGREKRLDQKNKESAPAGDKPAQSDAASARIDGDPIVISQRRRSQGTTNIDSTARPRVDLSKVIEARKQVIERNKEAEKRREEGTKSGQHVEGPVLQVEWTIRKRNAKYGQTPDKTPAGFFNQQAVASTESTVEMPRVKAESAKSAINPADSIMRPVEATKPSVGYSTFTYTNSSGMSQSTEIGKDDDIDSVLDRVLNAPGGEVESASPESFRTAQGTPDASSHRKKGKNAELEKPETPTKAKSTGGSDLTPSPSRDSADNRARVVLPLRPSVTASAKKLARAASAASEKKA